MKPPEGFTTDWRRMVRGSYIAVDCDPATASLTLSHHLDGNGTPPPFRHDLASGAALNWVASELRDEYGRGARHVYNNHFDVDGFLAAWVALNPDEAVHHRDAILAAAASGDFAEWTNDRAVQFAILGEWIDDPKYSAVARRALDLKERSSDEAMYDAVLAELPGLLYHPENMEELWRPLYEDIRRQVHLFETGEAQVREHADAHLSVVETPRVLRPRAVIAKARGDRLLQSVHAGGGHMYFFRYRPYLGYRIVSRPVTQTVSASELARRLNRAWPTEGERWVARGWWDREVMLTAKDGKKTVPRTPPEVAVPIFEDVLRSLDGSTSAEGARPSMAARS
ncbi:MAG TPA: DUF6687 family protein [Thermoplasmata archaeon]|nr:DUF6687 family protein [Thermoplasmata archaeon]